ncbi:MAG: M81 family metallopeptidase [Undibacterium sp.]|nr:M81 family metallopeptidase [Opitutaceae bacterium]
MRPRVLLAGLFHETHTFLDDPTSLADFERTEGAALLAKSGDASPLAGFLQVAQEAGWEVVPTIDLRAMPSGPVDDDVLDFFWTRFTGLAVPALAAGIDAIFLVLHGAMATRTQPDVEGELLERLRTLPGAADLPVFGVLDLHANLSARMAHHANCLVAYRENPHTDACATAIRAANLLRRALDQRILPITVWQGVPVVWTPPGTGTAAGPMLALGATARRIEADDSEIWAVNVAAGFSFADTPDTGVGFTVVTHGKPSDARRHLTTLAHQAWDLRAEGNVSYPPVETVLAQILPVARGPVILVEPSDNIGGGAPGDGTGLLRALLERNVLNAALCLNDPAAVTAAHTAGVSACVTLALGGRGSALDVGPVELAVEVISLRDGHFTLEDEHSHLASMSGRTFDMGPCAVVRHRGLTLLLTSRKTPPFDLGQWRSQGLEPRDFSLIGVKAAIAHRRAYDPITVASYYVDTPGPCSGRLDRFPFRHLRRPVYPLDAHVSFP